MKNSMVDFLAFMKEKKTNALEFVTSLVLGDVNMPVFEFRIHMEIHPNKLLKMNK